MREILFRGKSLSTSYGILERENGWVFGVPVPVKINAHMTERIEITQCHGYDELDYWVLLSEDEEVDPKTVGQYTGFKDKNSKKIFEGDIVRYSDTIRSVIFDEAFGEFEFDSKDPVENPDSLCLCVDYERCEIIGNIHDNPELLKGE